MLQDRRRRLRSLAVAALALALALGGAVRAEAQCVYPKVSTFGVVDNFAAIPTDPIPYNPALPQFVTYLNDSASPRPT